jgi:hypothetical protein
MTKKGERTKTAKRSIRRREFVSANEIKTLNLARLRASKEPELGGFVKEVLGLAWPV